MAFLCLECWDDKTVNEIAESWKCSNYGCDGMIAPIDDLMVIPIQLLNEKNLKTMFCCSGHPSDGSSLIPYVMISLTDSIDCNLTDDMFTVDSVHDVLKIPKNIDEFVSKLSVGNNFKEIHKHFKDNNFRIEISFNASQEKLRMTIRYPGYSNLETPIIGIDEMVNHTTYSNWLEYNRVFYETVQSCPVLEIETNS